MLEFFKAPFLVLHFSHYTLNDIPDDVDCDQASDLWQQLKLASELESDLRDTMDWGKSGLLISVLGKLNWFCLTGVTTLVLLM